MESSHTESSHTVADPDPDLNPDPDLVSLLRSLAKSNSFTMDELAENRVGRMARRQQRRSKRWLLKFIVQRAFFLGLSLAFLVAAVGDARHRVTDVIFDITFLGFVAWQCALWIRCSLQLLWDARGARVASVEGSGVAFNNGSKSIPRSYYVIGGKRFLVHRDACEALARGVYYRAYYAPHAGNLLSIEPLRKIESKSDAANQARA